MNQVAEDRSPVTLDEFPEGLAIAVAVRDEPLFGEPWELWHRFDFHSSQPSHIPTYPREGE